jgi:hypothetical protein
MQKSSILCVKWKQKKNKSVRLTPCPLFEAHFLKVMGATKSWIQSKKFHFLFCGHCFYLFLAGFSFMHFRSISFFQSSKHRYTVKVLVSRGKFRFLLAFFNHNTYTTPVWNCYLWNKSLLRFADIKVQKPVSTPYKTKKLNISKLTNSTEFSLNPRFSCNKKGDETRSLSWAT